MHCRDIERLQRAREREASYDAADRKAEEREVAEFMKKLEEKAKPKQDGDGDKEEGSSSSNNDSNKSSSSVGDEAEKGRAAEGTDSVQQQPRGVEKDGGKSKEQTSAAAVEEKGEGSMDMDMDMDMGSEDATAAKPAADEQRPEGSKAPEATTGGGDEKREEGADTEVNGTSSEGGGGGGGLGVMRLASKRVHVSAAFAGAEDEEDEHAAIRKRPKVSRIKYTDEQLKAAGLD